MCRAKTAAERDEQRAQWIERFSRFEKDGRTVLAFCAAEGVSSWSFYTWCQRLAAVTGAERSKRAVVTTAAPAAGASGFIDAGIARIVGAQRQAELSPAGVQVQIELGGGVLLRVVQR
jgi:hypothetical protein